MKYLILLIIICFQNTAFSKRIKNYKYPFAKRYMSTTLGSLSGSTIPYTPYKDIFLGNHRYRSNRNIPSAGLLLHKYETRPLVFVLGGFGAFASSGNVRVLSHYLHHKMGFHVIAMPDHLFWHFALTANKNIELGDFPNDIKNYSKLMKEALRKAQSMGLKFSDISIAGYSAGGLRSLFLAKQDKKEGFFNFKTVVAINPPFSVHQAGNVLDKAYNSWKKYTVKQKEILIQRGTSLYFKILDQPKGTNLLDFILKNYPYTEKQSMGLIGYQFRKDLTSYLGSVEAVNKTGLYANIKTVDSYNFNIYSYKVGFLEYINKFLYPFYSKKEYRLNKRKFIYRSSIYSLKRFLKSSSNVFIQHNQDDILLKNAKKDLKFLESILKNKILIYPTGGHAGNMWFPANIKHFLNFFIR